MNKEELLIGFIFGLCFYPVIGLWSIGLAFVSSILWALTGSGKSKLYRRLLIPIIASCLVYLSIKNWHIAISVPLAYGALSLGYGIPDNTDDGSLIGRFWFKITSKYANILTRATIYSLLLSSFLIGILWK